MVSCRNFVLVGAALCGSAFATPTTLTTQSVSCPASTPGTTTHTVTETTGPTSTVYAATFSDGVFLDCHGYSAVVGKTEKAGTATTTITAQGTATVAEYMCSQTSAPSGCGWPGVASIDGGLLNG